MQIKLAAIVIGSCIFSGQAFAEAACADQSVMDAFLERYVCSSAGPVMNCADNGISSYKELKSMSRGEIRTRLLKKIGSTSDISRLGDDPKFVAVDDAEVVGDSIAEAVPVLGNRVFQEFQNCSLELPECFVTRRALWKSVSALSTAV